MNRIIYLLAVLVGALALLPVAYYITGGRCRTSVPFDYTLPAASGLTVTAPMQGKPVRCVLDLGQDYSFLERGMHLGPLEEIGQPLIRGLVLAF